MPFFLSLLLLFGVVAAQEDCCVIPSSIQETLAYAINEARHNSPKNSEIRDISWVFVRFIDESEHYETGLIRRPLFSSPRIIADIQTTVITDSGQFVRTDRLEIVQFFFHPIHDHAIHALAKKIIDSIP